MYVGSHLTGWSANPAILQKAHAPLGRVAGSNWTVVGNPSGSSDTFNSQVCEL